MGISGGEEGFGAFPLDEKVVTHVQIWKNRSHRKKTFSISDTVFGKEPRHSREEEDQEESELPLSAANRDITAGRRQMEEIRDQHSRLGKCFQTFCSSSRNLGTSLFFFFFLFLAT